MKNLIGRKIYIKKHFEFKNDGSPSVIENSFGKICDFNEVYKQFHVDTDDGYYFEVKRRNFTLIKE